MVAPISSSEAVPPPSRETAEPVESTVHIQRGDVLESLASRLVVLQPPPVATTLQWASVEPNASESVRPIAAKPVAEELRQLTAELIPKAGSTASFTGTSSSNFPIAVQFLRLGPNDVPPGGFSVRESQLVKGASITRTTVYDARGAWTSARYDDELSRIHDVYTHDANGRISASRDGKPVPNAANEVEKAMAQRADDHLSQLRAVKREVDHKKTPTKVA